MVLKDNEMYEWFVFPETLILVNELRYESYASMVSLNKCNMKKHYTNIS